MIGFNFERESLQRIYELYLPLCVSNPENVMVCEDKIFVNVTHARGETMLGTLIIPADGSYIRFVSNSWYDGVDPESL